ncbi:hypothetical protein [Glaciibacter superstes]|uniref:hypothetical protein n=1 Tax=Glaciibacter superstes TaxID=501023 RepID=UPI0003B3CE3B|nr:hypothetical protein [Glaciibacter superstes]
MAVEYVGPPSTSPRDIVTRGEVDSALEGKSDTDHEHSAVDITSGTLLVARGGTGRASQTARALVIGGTTSTAAQVSVPVGTAGQILQSGGSSANPSWVARDLTGTYAARPAASTVPDGTIYYCTEIEEAYRSTGSAWVVVGHGGSELGYAESTAFFSTSTTTLVDVPGLTITFKAGTRPVELRCDANVANENGVVETILSMRLGATEKARIETRGGGTDLWHSVSRRVRVSGLTPGASYVYKVQVKSGTDAIGARVSGDATNPMGISVVSL